MALLTVLTVFLEVTKDHWHYGSIDMAGLIQHATSKGELALGDSPHPIGFDDKTE